MPLLTPESEDHTEPCAVEISELAPFLTSLFRTYPGELQRVVSYAHKTREAIDGIDSSIEEVTSSVCPDCRKVCCTNRHAYHDLTDLVYVHALGLSPPDYRRGLRDAGPCQFVSAHGCTIKRHSRPFRCTWYFCDALLEYMGNGPAKAFRRFSSRFQGIIDMRRELTEEFFRVVQSCPHREKERMSLYTNRVKS